MKDHWYEVQASTDLVSWVTAIQTGFAATDGMTQCADVQSTPMPNRYYRLVLH